MKITTERELAVNTDGLRQASALTYDCPMRQGYACASHGRDMRYTSIHGCISDRYTLTLDLEFILTA